MSEAAAVERVLARLVETPGPLETPCWLWPGARSGNGYGYVAVGGRKGRRVTVHALLFRVLTGKRVRRDQRLHHRCEQRLCANPAHLEPLTARQHATRHFDGLCICGEPLDATYGRSRHRVHRACRAAYKRRRYALGLA